MTTANLNTFAGRLASFDGPVQLSKRRVSSAKKKTPTTVLWPHERPSPEQLARAGFYYKPSAASQDSVTCFLCNKALDGWDPNDNPAFEHLAHVPECGWAINVCIELRSQDMDRVEEDPRNQKMTEARRATFKDDWPHEGKRGWKCKVQKMVDAGWSYEPLPEGDDCVKCFYCGVSLDGWEPRDDPWEEHQRRSPDCHFFTLIKDASEAEQLSKSRIRRASRFSKTSRLSTQSMTSVMSEAPSFASSEGDAAEVDDTILTSASGKTRTGKNRGKATTTKRASRTAKPARKTKRKPSGVLAYEPVHEAAELNEVAYDEPFETSFVKQISRATNDRRIATKPTTTTNAEASLLERTAEPMSPPTRAALAKASKKPRTVNKRASQLPDDADITIPEVQPRMKPVQGKTATKADAATLNSSVVVLDDSVPGPKSTVTNPNARATRGKKHTSNGSDKIDSPRLILDDVPAPDLKAKVTRGKKRMSDGSEKANTSNTIPPVLVQPATKLTTKQKGTKALVRRDTALRQGSSPEHLAESELRQSVMLSIQSPQQKTKPGKKAVARRNEASTVDALKETVRTSSPGQMRPAAAGPQTSQEAETHHAHSSPFPVRKESTAPSSSPRSSDAENRPPSSRPSIAAPPAASTRSPEGTSQVTMPPETPIASPSKRSENRHGLHSLFPWNKIDLETAFLPSPSAEPRREGTKATVEETLQRLDSAEKAMSVEEWIIWNARRAEDRLKGECERLINKFESAGVHALRAVEGIECI